MKEKKDSVLLLENYDYQGSCCDHLQVNDKSDDASFPHKNLLGFFDIYLDIEGEPMVTYGASCFAHKTEKIYLYRSKYGHWCIGSKLGKMKNGTLLKSCERDEEKWAQCCPCRIKKWLRRDGDSWVSEESVTVKIRRERRIIMM